MNRWETEPKMLVGFSFFGLLQIALHWPRLQSKAIKSVLVQSGKLFSFFFVVFINLIVTAV